MEDNSEGGGDANNAQDNEGEQVESKVLWKLLKKHVNHNHMFFYQCGIYFLTDLIFVLGSQLRRL